MWITRAGVPAASLLSSWESYAWSDHVQMDHLAACDRLTVLTLHTTHRTTPKRRSRLSTSNPAIEFRQGESSAIDSNADDTQWPSP